MISSIKDIEKYLIQYIPGSNVTRFPGEEGIIRTKEFLKLLGSPQNKLKVIHVAGTSGKGSTSFMISAFLHALGYKTGLHLSPHLLDIRERTEINNKLLDEKKYVSYFNEIVPSIEKMTRSQWGMITYFEVMVGFAYYLFVRESVDYAIMEVGLGGKYDGTNVVDRADKLAVISKIGFDHMNVLGNTLGKIAYQKAMICRERGDMISIYQTSSVEREIMSIAKQKKAHLYFVEKKAIQNISYQKEKTQFTFCWDKKTHEKLVIGLFGAHQAQNAALALSTILFLGKRDHFVVDMQKIRSCADTLQFKGRMDIIHRNGKLIILDGAHNVQKMKAFLQALATFSPHKKYTFVIAFKKGKEFNKMVRLMLPFAHEIVITLIFSENPDFLYLSTDPILIQKELARNNFTNVRVVKENSEVQRFIKESKTDIVVTGSLYLLGDIYKLIGHSE